MMILFPTHCSRPLKINPHPPRILTDPSYLWLHTATSEWDIEQKVNT